MGDRARVLCGRTLGVVAADTLELQHLSIAKCKTLGNMRPICEFEKLAFDSKIVWSHGHILRFEVVIDGVASSTKQQNFQKIDLDDVTSDMCPESLHESHVLDGQYL